MDTVVYVDGFNLYYGALKGTPYKWLNLLALCKNLLDNQHRIVKVKYYTAKVSVRPHDPTQPQRQQTYLRALQTVPQIEIILGQFLQSRVVMPVATPAPGQPPFVKVIKTEEKGSDVNIATHLIHDGHLGLYDTAVVISNDSDLTEPVRIVRHELNKGVGLLNPHKRPSWELKQHATFIKTIRQGVLRKSQFPPTLTDTTGSIHKPPSW